MSCSWKYESDKGTAEGIANIVDKNAASTADLTIECKTLKNSMPGSDAAKQVADEAQSRLKLALYQSIKDRQKMQFFAAH